MTAIGSRLLASRAGSIATEFALVAPFLLLSLLGVEEFGRLIWTQVTLHYAVEQAARCGAVDSTTCSSSTQIQSFAASQAPGLGLAPAQFTVSTPSCGEEVSASFPFAFVVPNLLPFSVTVGAQSCYPK